MKNYNMEIVKLLDILAKYEKDNLIMHFNKTNFIKTNRIFITGLMCSGKTTLSKRLKIAESIQIIELDKFWYGFPINYKNSARPKIVEKFFNNYVDDNDYLDRVSNFIKFVINYSSNDIIIVEGFQLLNNIDILKDEYLIVLDTPIDIIPQRFLNRAGSLENISICKETPKTFEHLIELVLKYYNKEYYKVSNLKKNGLK